MLNSLAMRHIQIIRNFEWPIVLSLNVQLKATLVYGRVNKKRLWSTGLLHTIDLITETSDACRKDSFDWGAAKCDNPVNNLATKCLVAGGKFPK